MADPITLPVGDIAFYDNYIPSLEGGIYNIVVESGIDGVDTGDYFTNPVSQTFEVRAPQFTIDSNEVHAVYPPGGSNAVYDEVLPHIVLQTPALPWERYLDLNDDTLPWLALLVVNENEITVDPVSGSSLVPVTVSDLLTPGTDTLRPAIATADVPADVLGSTCQTIIISADTFNAVVPLQDDLKYLAHVRQVNTGNQVVMGMDDTGWYSVVTGNRLLAGAASGTKFHVHLVSLEGFLLYISGTAIPGKGSNPAEQQDVQLVSLYNWSFVSQQDTGTSFADLAAGFVSEEQSGAPDLLLRRNMPQPVNPAPAMQQVAERMANGYVALSWQAPTNENSFAWYRGPFSPVIAQPLPRDPQSPHYPSSAAAMIYDATAGVFDHSYSSAWSIGRALALGDGTFGPAMLAWRRQTYRLLGQLIDNLAAQGINDETDLQKILAGNVVMNTFDQLIAGEMGTQLSNVIHQPVKANPAALKNTTAATAPDPVALAQQYLTTPAVQNVLKEAVSDYLAPVAAWIAKKQLLHDVPFNHLVPDPAMLPEESLRVFYIDQNWLDVLTDGALSIGIQGSKDAFVTQAMRGVIDDAVKTNIQTLRAGIPGTSTGDVEAASAAEAMSGMLIRSAMVSGWPGLQVDASYKGQALKILRMDHLSNDVLLVIFLDVPDTISLTEPQQGFRFGIEDGGVINLRAITGNVGQPLGKTFPASGGFAQYARATVNGMGGNVLNINSGAKNIVNDLTVAQQAAQTLRPSEFAIQMVKAPEQLTFNPTTVLPTPMVQPAPLPAPRPHHPVTPVAPSSPVAPHTPAEGLSPFARFFRWLARIWKTILAFFGIK